MPEERHPSFSVSKDHVEADSSPYGARASTAPPQERTAPPAEASAAAAPAPEERDLEAEMEARARASMHLRAQSTAAPAPTVAEEAAEEARASAHAALSARAAALQARAEDAEVRLHESSETFLLLMARRAAAVQQRARGRLARRRLARALQGWRGAVEARQADEVDARCGALEQALRAAQADARAARTEADAAREAAAEAHAQLVAEACAHSETLRERAALRARVAAAEGALDAAQRAAAEVAGSVGRSASEPAGMGVADAATSPASPAEMLRAAAAHTAAALRGREPADSSPVPVDAAGAPLPEAAAAQSPAAAGGVAAQGSWTALPNLSPEGDATRRSRGGTPAELSLSPSPAPESSPSPSPTPHDAARAPTDAVVRDGAPQQDAASPAPCDVTGALRLMDLPAQGARNASPPHDPTSPPPTQSDPTSPPPTQSDPTSPPQHLSPLADPLALAPPANDPRGPGAPPEQPAPSAPGASPPALQAPPAPRWREMGNPFSPSTPRARRSAPDGPPAPERASGADRPGPVGGRDGSAHRAEPARSPETPPRGGVDDGQRQGGPARGKAAAGLWGRVGGAMTALCGPLTPLRGTPARPLTADSGTPVPAIAQWPGSPPRTAAAGALLDTALFGDLAAPSPAGLRQLGMSPIAHAAPERAPLQEVQDTSSDEPRLASLSADSPGAAQLGLLARGDAAGQQHPRAARASGGAGAELSVDLTPRSVLQDAPSYAVSPPPPSPLQEMSAEASVAEEEQGALEGAAWARRAEAGRWGRGSNESSGEIMHF
jgi:hypothetical protein